MINELEGIEQERKDIQEEMKKQHNELEELKLEEERYVPSEVVQVLNTP